MTKRKQEVPDVEPGNGQPVLYEGCLEPMTLEVIKAKTLKERKKRVKDLTSLRGENATPVAGALCSENSRVILLALQSHKLTC